MSTRSVLTDAGRALTAKLIASAAPLHLTKAQLGDGVLPEGTAPTSVTALAHYVMDAAIQEVGLPVSGQVQVILQTMPTAVSAAFVAREGALFASDPDAGEILFAYISMLDAPVELRPMAGGVGRILTLEISVVVSGVSEVTAQIDPSANAKLLTLIEKRTTQLTVGTSTAGHTLNDCDYLCDGVDDQVEINAAIQALTSGASDVLILAGTYILTGPVQANKPGITIIGVKNGTIFNRAWESVGRQGVINISGENCCVKQISVDGQKDIYTGGYNTAIYITGSKSTVKDCTVENNSNVGIYPREADGTTVKGCICNNSKNGIYAYGSSLLNVSGNQCKGNSAQAIYVQSCENSNIFKNTCTQNQHGIYLQACKYCAVQENVNSNNGFSGVYCKECASCIIQGNRCLENQYYNVFFDNCVECRVEKNELAKTQNGIFVNSGGGRNEYLRNKVLDCSAQGIVIQGQASTISDNIISGNAGNTGIKVNGAMGEPNNITISGNTISLFATRGIDIANSDTEGALVLNNYITGAYEGIYCYGRSKIIIRGNRLISATPEDGYGICGGRCDNSDISNNCCFGFKDGISVDSATGLSILGNICSDNSNGIKISGVKCSLISENVCIRGSGQISDYSSSQQTIYLWMTANEKNLIANNNIIGKNYKTDGGGNNTFDNNKYQ